MIRSVLRFRLVFALAALALLLPTSASAQSVKHLPSETEVLVSLNLKQVWSSQLVKDFNQIIKQLQSEFNFKVDKNAFIGDLKKDLGIDLFKDVDVVTVGIADSTKETKNAVIVVQGRFNPEKYNESAKQDAKKNPETVKVLTIGEKTVVQRTDAGAQPMLIAVYDKSTLLVASTKEAMTAAINTPNPEMNKGMAELLKKVSLKKSLNIALSGTAFDEMVKNSNKGPGQEFAPLLKEGSGMIIAANVVSDIDFSLSIFTKNADKAEQLVKALNTNLDKLKKFLGGMENPNADLGISVLKSLKVTNQGSTLEVNGTVPSEVVTEVMKMIEKTLP